MVETKKAPDYSNSAENLCNPLGVKELLDRLHQEQTILNTFNEELKTNNAELFGQIEDCTKRIADLTANIKSAVEAQGSYQNIEAGDYAVKYRRVSKSYDAEHFQSAFPQFVPAVIVPTVNVDALKGLIKGGLITEDELKHNRVLIETTQHAFYIR